MQSRLKFIRQRLAYYARSPLRGVLYVLGRLGAKVNPYYLYREGLDLMPQRDWDGLLAGHRVEMLGRSDMPALAALSDRKTGKGELLDRLEHGCACLALRRGGEIVGFTWWNTARCSFSPHTFELKPDEAYLFDAWVSPTCRGAGLAELLRYCAYRQLAGQGRTRLYSISERSNVPAMRFKRKLGAKIIDNGIYVELLGKWSWTRRTRGFHIPRKATGPSSA